MRLITSTAELKQITQDAKQDGKTIGLVPTMGYLHAGHVSLIKQSAAQNDLTAVSVFVNPIQFGTGEDLDTYPRDLEGDLATTGAAGADILFHPSAAEMYPPGYRTFIQVEEITSILCGKSRPGHFRGVSTVVLKLFQISRADRAYFGQKDAQQLAVIRRMVEDLNLDTKIIPCPIVREADGLAMSSRNTYLSPEERAAAPVLYQALKAAKKLYLKGERDASVLTSAAENLIRTAPCAEIEYIEAVTFPDLAPCNQISSPALIAAAVRFGTTRLIDNILLGGEAETCR